MTVVRVRDIERAIATEFPLERAEEWDRCGLLAGDGRAVVTGVVLALDPTLAAIDAAAAHGANVLVTHHPAFLSPPDRVVPGGGAAGVVFSAVAQGVALVNAHTNLDRDVRAQRLIPATLGLEPLEPLEGALQQMTLVTVFAPPSAAEEIVDAMAAAGAGRVGQYRRCAFASPGEGTYVAPEHGHPVAGAPGERSEAAEVRIEMVCAAALEEKVTAAAVSAHPYEEPLVLVGRTAAARNSARLGMVCATSTPMSLGELAHEAASAYACTPRVWGDAATQVSRVATATGSAGSLLGDVVASGSQALVAGEVRYHDALEAVASGVGVIELGHDVTEWPLVSLLEDAVRSVAGLPDTAVHVLPADRGWWTPARLEGAQ